MGIHLKVFRAFGIRIRFLWVCKAKTHWTRDS